ncbi:MAG: pyridoxal phosphate-dependent aminotransferase [Myxococcota bacterium]
MPRTGVIFVTTEATKAGFRGDDPGWCNLGQGQPEAGALDGAPPRVDTVTIDSFDQEYAPVAGLPELREAVAALYNRLYRKGRRSQYTAENVAISGGGRAALTRAAASLGNIHLGHFLPDYTAYEELLDIFRAFSPIPIMLEPERGYAFTPDDLKKEILGRGLGALLMSNPCNPSGKLVRGEDLNRWVELSRELDCALILDEFYSHYIWVPTEGELPVESAARYVDDVDRDPVVIVDGLTKNWRYPGWRVCWTVGPKSVIDTVTSAGSFLDGGGSRSLQRAAIPLLEEEAVRSETLAVAKTFRKKRDRLLQRLQDIGVRCDLVPEGTFYIWGCLDNLPPPLNEGMGLFRAALDEQVITVPGEFFDVNPGKKRRRRQNRFGSYSRFSFGPPIEQLELACDRIEAIVERHRTR